MSDYDAWLTTEPTDEQFCPACMRVVVDFEYDADEQTTIATCECGWSGTDTQLLRDWELAEQAAIDRADMLYDMRREGLL